MSTCNNFCSVWSQCGYEYKGMCDCVLQRKFKPIESFATPVASKWPAKLPKGSKSAIPSRFKKPDISAKNAQNGENTGRPLDNNPLVIQNNAALSRITRQDENGENQERIEPKSEEGSRT